MKSKPYRINVVILLCGMIFCVMACYIGDIPIPGTEPTPTVTSAPTDEPPPTAIPIPLWTVETKLIASDGQPGDNFGHWVNISGDYAVINALYDDDIGTDSGSVYVFHWDGKTWTEQQKLTASDGAAGDNFGMRVDIYGDYIICGARNNDANGTDSGAAYIFHRSGTTWTEQQKLLPGDGAAGDKFGGGVDIYGDYAVVGAYYDDDNGTDSGSVYVFHRDGTTWTEQQKLTPGDGGAGDVFGATVCIFGDYILVGANYYDNNATDTGAAYVFAWNGESWIEWQTLLPEDGAAYDNFGCHMDICENYASICNVFDDDKGTDSGSVYIYYLDETIWTLQQKLTADDGAPYDGYGTSGITENYAIVGAHYDEDDGSKSGSAYIYKRDGTIWTEYSKLLPDDGAAGDRFGYGVAISEDHIIVGALMDDDNGTDSGSVYFYK